MFAFFEKYYLKKKVLKKSVISNRNREFPDKETILNECM